VVAGSQLVASGTGVFATFSATMSLCSENSSISDAGQRITDVLELETGYNKVQLTCSEFSGISSLESVL
jgi:hypothetical protein